MVHRECHVEVSEKGDAFGSRFASAFCSNWQEPLPLSRSCILIYRLIMLRSLSATKPLASVTSVAPIAIKICLQLIRSNDSQLKAIFYFFKSKSCCKVSDQNLNSRIIFEITNSTNRQNALVNYTPLK